MLRASESGAAVTAIAFSSDGSRLAAATADGMLVLWSVGGDCSGRPAAAGEGSSGAGEPQLLARLASCCVTRRRYGRDFPSWSRFASFAQMVRVDGSLPLPTATEHGMQCRLSPRRRCPHVEPVEAPGKGDAFEQ